MEIIGTIFETNHFSLVKLVVQEMYIFQHRVSLARFKRTIFHNFICLSKCSRVWREELDSATLNIDSPTSACH